MLELIGVRQSYPWGTKDAIPSLIGQAPDAKPWAEQWYGAHPLGDSPHPMARRCRSTWRSNRTSWARPP